MQSNTKMKSAKEKIQNEDPVCYTCYISVLVLIFDASILFLKNSKTSVKACVFPTQFFLFSQVVFLFFKVGTKSQSTSLHKR